MAVASLLDTTLRVAKEKTEVFSPEVVELYDELRKMAFGIKGAGSSKAQQVAAEKKTENEIEKEQIEAMLAKIAGANLRQSHKKQLSELLGIDQMALNTATSMERAKKNPPLEQYFEKWIESVITDEKGSIDSKKLDDLIAVKESFLLSIVHTMHPVVWHTPEAKDFEWGLKDIGESAVDALRSIPQGGSLPQELLGKFAGSIADFIDKISERNEKGKADKSISPLRREQKATVSGENIQEDQNLDRMKKTLEMVSQNWNIAIDSLAVKHTTAQEKLGQLNFSEDMKHVVFRQWGGSADADGRDASTSLELFRTIQKRTKDKKYEGALLDLRQNAKVHIDLLSGLIQHKFNSGDEAFVNMCTTFAEGKKVKGKDIAYKAHLNILQQLSTDDQEAFIKKIIKDDKTHIVAPVLVNQPGVFNRQFQEECEKLCDILGIDQYASLNELERIKLPVEQDKRNQLLQYLGFDNPAILDEYKNIYDVLKTKIKKIDFPGMIEKSSKFELSGLNYRAQYPHDGGEFFDKQKMMFAGDVVDMDLKTRFATLDVVKRLTVIKTALDNKLKIADRHQIANFSSAADFYSLMLLMKETGLMKIENGVVKEPPPIAIQPLLETSEDMRNAKKIFSKLLKDPLAKSYYQKMGKAHFMVGFSDGAKSAGNFASEWEIRKCKKELYKLFRDEFGPTFELEILNGNGRGVNRGGVVEGGTASAVAPLEEQVTAKLDRTIQGDEPFDLASSPSYSEEYFGSTLVGTMNTALRARKNMARLDPKSPSHDAPFKARMDAYEQICGFLASASEAKFVSTIVKDDQYEAALKADPKDMKIIKAQPAADVLKFIGHVPDNSLRSSRDPKRPQSGDPVKDYDATRAITTEKAFEKAGLVTNDVGFKHALIEFEKEYANHPGWHVIEKKDDKYYDIGAKKVLEKMYQEFDFFHTMVNKRIVNLNNYKPEIAEKYAVASGSEAFVKKIRGELDGLKEKLFDIRGSALVNIGNPLKSKDYSIAPPIKLENPFYADVSDPCEPIRFDAVNKSMALGKLANALILSHAADGNGNVGKTDSVSLNPSLDERVKDIDRADTLHNCEFAVAQALVAAQKMPERAALRRAVTGGIAA